MKKNTKIVDKRFAKKKEYLKTLETIETEGKRPFCPDNFKYHKKAILKEINGWFITENNYPYKNAKYHFIIIGKKHKEYFSELTIQDLSAVKKLVDWTTKKFNIKGGALTIRFGDTKLTGSTVCHLHFHLISPKIKKDGLGKTVIFPIG